MLLNGDADLAFFNLPVKSPDIDYEIICHEELLLILPAHHPLVNQMCIRDRFEIWKEEFDSLAVEGRMINFVLHPQFVGRASRVQMLSRLIGYMKSHGAWLDTNRAVASWVLKENGFQVPDHE